MNRRTFVLLTGSAARALALPRRPPTRDPEIGQLRFALDDGRRWSLSYVTDTGARPLVQDATLGAWIADQFVTLADLQYSAVGERRLPDGRSLVARGRAANVFVEAEFFTASLPGAYAVVTLRVYPERALPTVGGVRFLQTAPSEIVPGDSSLVALVNGYASSSPTEMVDVSTSDFTSCTTLGLTRGDEGLAFAFGPEDPGDGVFALAAGTLEAASHFTPPRTLRPVGDASSLRIAYDSTGDGLSALRQLFQPAARVDRDRLSRTVAPTGWRIGRGTRTTAVGDVRARLAACGRLDPRYARAFEIGNGYQRAIGAWDTSDGFPDGHRALTTEVHAQGLLAGLWLAPFAASERSGIPAAHPGWLVKGADGAPIVWDPKDPDGALYILDGAHPEVRGWLSDLARRATEDWGYDYLALDWLGMATAGTQYAGSVTRAEAYRAGLAALRRGAGPDVSLLASDAPLQHAVGLVDAMAVGAPADSTWAGLAGAARATAQRSFYHRAAWLNDPDLLRLAASGDPEASLRASLTAVLGGVTFCADDPATLPAERVALLARTMPSVSCLGRPIGIPGSAPGLSNIWVAQGAPGWWTVVLINWGDQTADVEATFEALGLPRTTYTAYDVWGNTPLPDVTDRICATLESRTSLTLGLRAALRTPQVVGSTRHVVQGIDISAEAWLAGSRTLEATASVLDHRPYTVVIAVPRGFEPVACTADPGCTLTTLATGHAVLAWEAGDGGDLPWSLAFRTRHG